MLLPLPLRAWFRFAPILTLVGLPANAERMQDKDISDRHLARVRDDFVGVIDHAINGDTPGLVADDSCAVLAGGLGSVTVAVKNGIGVVVRHGLFPKASVLTRRRPYRTPLDGH